MTDDYGFFGYIVRNALMIRTLHSRFMGRHANTVGYDLGEYLVVLDLGQLEFVESEVVLAVQSYSFVQHGILPPYKYI